MQELLHLMENYGKRNMKMPANAPRKYDHTEESRLILRANCDILYKKRYVLKKEKCAVRCLSESAGHADGNGNIVL